MNAALRRLLVALTGLAVVATSLLLAGPASARPNCDGPNPPPICDPPERPPVPLPRTPDLQIAVAGPTNAVAGSTVTYVVTVTNPVAPLARSASGWGLVATPSGGASVSSLAVNGTLSCTNSGSAINCSGGSIAIGGTVTLTLIVQLPGTAGSIGVQATVDPSNAVAERSESNNTAGASTAVSVPVRPDLTAAMTGPSTVRGVYANGVWTMTIGNRGPVAADPVRVSWLTNWGGTVNARYTSSGSVGVTCFVPAEYVQQEIRCFTAAPLPAGGSVTITITAVPPDYRNVYGSPGQSVVTATADYVQAVAESDETNNVATVNSTITP